MACPNINTDAWRALVNKIGVRQAYAEFVKNNSEIPDAANYQDTFKGVNATLKVIGALNNPKMQQVYDRFFGSNKEKFFAELLNNGATKDQVTLLRDYLSRNNPQSLEDMVAGIAAEMSYTVEINEATKPRLSQTYDQAMDDLSQWGSDQELNPDDYDSEPTTYNEPTQHYAGLSVPGGINYRENEIRTPDIIPVRQGHAQFSTDKGIGWFRSDDKISGYSITEGDREASEAFGLPVEGSKAVASNTRRILEIQSDLFQKERENARLVNWQEQAYDNGDEGAAKANQFLQVLNKDNNWVNLFVKSIMQDSTRKGYEYVMFPAGDTAAQIEGHQTIQEFIEGRKRMIQEIRSRMTGTPGGEETSHYNKEGHEVFQENGRYYRTTAGEELVNGIRQVEISKEDYERGLQEDKESDLREISEYEREIEGARNGTLGLGAIASFYENTIQNILNKQQYGPTRITDEHGNEWFKVPTKDNYKDTIYFYKQEGDSSFQKRAYAYLQAEGLITSQEKSGQKRWIISNKGDGDTVSVQALNYQKIAEIGHDYKEKYGFNPINIVHDGKDYVVTVNGTQVFHRDNAAIEGARETTLNLLNRLQEKTGLPFEIISDDQVDAMLGDESDDNIRAFFKDGKVYMLENHLNPDIAFHEYAHPFITSLRLSDPVLYSRLLQEFRSSPEGQALEKGLSSPEYYGKLLTSGETAAQRIGNKTQFEDELLVRALTNVAQGETTFESPQGKSFWQKLWFGIKQLLRRVFGGNVDLQKLSPTTSLRDLAGMLLGDKPINFPYKEVDYTLFNRDIAKEMESIPNHGALKTIETFSRVAQDHLLKLRENGHYKELRDILKNQADGSILNDISKLLSLSKNKEDQMDTDFKQLTNFARAVVGARILSEKMKAHVNEMSTRQMDERDKLRTMRYYSFISNDWLQAFDNLRELNKQDLPLLGDEVARAANNFRRINDLVGEAFKEGLVATMRDQLTDITSNIREELGPQIDKVKKEVEAGNTKLQGRLDYLQKMHDHGTFDDDKIRKLLQGELGDTNWFSSIFESYTSSPDPIVGGFAKYFNQELYKVESTVQEFSTNLGNELSPLYKQYGVDISKPEDLGHQLVFKDIAFTKDEAGNPKGHEVWTLLHEFGNGYQYDYALLQHQIDEAKESGDTKKTIELQQKFNQLRKDYFHREYLDEVYNVKEFWNESDINRLAQTRRKEITDQLAGYEAESGFKDLTEDDRNHIDQLISQLRQLSSTKNLDGTDKSGDDLGVAQAIREYNKRMMKYREEVAMKGAFERDMQSQIDDLLDKGLKEGSPEFEQGLNSWLKQNLRVRLSDVFYESRNKITDQIAEIVKKLPQDQAKQLDVESAWKDMFEQLKGFRDQDGQPVGTDLSADKVRHVKELQDKINDINDTLRRLNGLTGEEQERYSQLWGKITAGQTLDGQENAEFNDLTNRKKLLGLAPGDKARLMSLFEELRQFQSKIPTEYYLEAMNQKLQEASMQGEVTMDNADMYLDAGSVDPFIEANPDNPFVKWFQANHIARVKWDATTQQYKGEYERLYIWNRIVPNDATFKNALANNDYRTLLNINNPMVQIKPAAKYFFYRIKNEFRTKRVVGQTVDNRGNWLPRTMQQGAKDSKYQNKQYYDLKNSKDPHQNTLYRILETYKKYHLQTQEESPKYGRLWYELPRIRKERIENLENMARNPSNAGKNVLSWIGSRVSWKSRVDAFDDALIGPKGLKKNVNRMYVATDLFGNEINSIPQKFMSKLDADEVSMDVGRSVVKYAMSLSINKALQEINPIAQALKQTLASEGIKDLNKVSTRNWLSRFTNIPVLSRDNIRLKTITNMVERDIEGIENHMELGLFGSKIAQHVMGLQAFGSLALNIPAGIKNVTVAKLQNHLEANSNEFFSQGNLMKADQVFAKRFMPKLIHDYNKFSGRSLETQMFELFDFVQGKFEEHVGESFSASYKKDIGRLRFTRSFQTLGELQAQGQAGIAMMLKQMVPWRHDGVTTIIPYLDAWELKNGVIDVKDGVDKSWGKQGNNFASFKLRIHKINELMQGAYAKMNQAEASRYTAFKMFNFMRRYLVPGLVNRFSVNRNNVALGTQREGYYVGFLRLGLDMARSHGKNWAVYTEKEKRNAFKTLTEIGYAASLFALMGMMGYNSSDPDKNKKLKANSWAFNMALYEVVMIKGEIENFIPFPGMGVSEILRMKDQPSIAFPVFNKYYKVISHLIDLIQQPFSDYDQIHYRTSSGIYHKGDLKLMADLLKMIGYTGATLHPDNAVKNYMATTNRYE